MRYSTEELEAINTTRTRLEEHNALSWLARIADRWGSDYPQKSSREELRRYDLGPAGRIHENIRIALLDTRQATRRLSRTRGYVDTVNDIDPSIDSSIMIQVKDRSDYHELFEALGLRHEPSREKIPALYRVFGGQQVRPEQEVGLGAGVYVERNKKTDQSLQGIYTATDDQTPISKVALTPELLESLDEPTSELLEGFTVDVRNHAFMASVMSGSL